jgi:DDE superfamily endonuclease
MKMILKLTSVIDQNLKIDNYVAVDCGVFEFAWPMIAATTLPIYFTRSFHDVLGALLILPSFVRLPNLNIPLASRISTDGRFASYFKDCIGAIDGTHIAASVPTEEHARYRNRKGFLSQSVLAACDFDLNFVYVLPGWEGSAHDGRVLADAQAHPLESIG